MNETAWINVNGDKPPDAWVIHEEKAPGVYVEYDSDTGEVYRVLVDNPQLVRVKGEIVWASAAQQERWMRGGKSVGGA